ncbi:GNAT family N-acetyltransferase [Desertivirga brevis]|uniref:GNAT family N-acetyltransferase n=1 Tax=Desertivirga brevis TaxID=2810310 RepID=UPI001A9621B5|nr:GNAT family N-acetyltransferase [Pedobacter sp. SYSU D00873]
MIEEKVNFKKNTQTELETTTEFYRTNGEDTKFKDLINELDENLQAIYSNEGYKFDIDLSVTGLDTVVLAAIGGITIGGGCFKVIDQKTAEVKRVFVSPYFRGLNVGSGIMQEIIDWAKELHFKELVLETGELQHQALQLFKKYGFEKINNFGPYIGVKGSICMGRRL